MNVLRLSSLRHSVTQTPLCHADFGLSTFDRTIFWTDGILTLLASSFLMLGFLRFKELRKQPGDIIILIALSDFIVSIYWLILGAFRCGTIPVSYLQKIDLIGTFGSITQYLYNTSFNIFLILSIRNSLKQAKIPKLGFHIVNLAISFGCLGFLLLQQQKTLNNKAVKFWGFTLFNYAGTILAIAYVALGTFTYCYVENNLSKCARIHKKRTDFLRYYMRYIVASTFTYLFLIVFPNLEQSLKETDKIHSVWITYSYKILELCSPLIIIYYRYNDPTIKHCMRKTLMLWKKDSQQAKVVADNGEKHEYVDENGELHEKHFMFEDLSTHLKVELTYTLLACVIFVNTLPKISFRSTKPLLTADEKKTNRYKHEQVFVIEEKAIAANLPEVQAELQKHNYSVLSGTLKIYAPEVFSSFIEEDSDILDISKSFDLVDNIEQIKKASGGDGGKSGEFFFFSKDQRLILKTIPSSELNMMISILERYEKHLTIYPNTLIAKIYGVYTYENTDIGLTINLILMKNMCGFPSNFVRRKYDIKGSKHDRKVIKENIAMTQSKFKKTVLKDLDFEEYEQKLDIKPEIKQEFLDQVTKDSYFFKTAGLIDYSFMISIVNKAEAAKTMDLSRDFTAKNRLASIESASEAGIYYNMGIIDYLQAYTFKKMCEKWLKRLKYFDFNLETSSQDPYYYSMRFIKFVYKIVRPEE